MRGDRTDLAGKGKRNGERRRIVVLSLLVRLASRQLPAASTTHLRFHLSRENDENGEARRARGKRSPSFPLSLPSPFSISIFISLHERRDAKRRSEGGARRCAVLTPTLSRLLPVLDPTYHSSPTRFRKRLLKNFLPSLSDDAAAPAAAAADLVLMLY